MREMLSESQRARFAALPEMEARANSPDTTPSPKPTWPR